MKPFTKLLVANRGEIALRVMRTAHAMGHRTVAVFSTADADAPHVRAAGEAVCIGGALPAESYLNIDALLAAARASGADAVHPGYGFLAENAGFAAACRAAGLVFVGPPAEAMHAMADKARAKRLMAEAGVPCIPGWHGDETNDAQLAAEAERIGWPLMIKASAGGGGRGMRLVRSAAEFAAALRGARAEAEHAFGHGGVLLERALEAPRHVEVQVFADRHGNVIHLGERDCSVQRRHQKLIEETPSPAVDAPLRERMGAAAVQAARAVGYEGAGTVEFLLDADGAFFFMEMNTRLQVEHPVTEAVTGLDLVEWQLRIAAGEALPLAQHVVRPSGHAIEVRLCAEDAARGFVPQAGVLRRWSPPGGVRVDHALASGLTIPPFYDSMIAKLIAHGATRDEARRRLLGALADLGALGITTNQAFLARCLAHPVFVQGAATTAFVEQHLPALAEGAAVEREHARRVAAWLLASGGAAPGEGHALPLALRFVFDGEPCSARVTTHGPRVDIDGRRLDAIAVGAGEARCVIDGVQQRVRFERDGERLWLQLGSRVHAVEDRTLAASARAGASDGRVLASTSGRVVAVFAAAGEHVAAGQPLLTLEAMKMEHVHAAPLAGTLAALHVAVGEQVAARRLVAEVVPG